MAIKTISELDIAGRRLFVRVDFNVPLTPAGGVADDTRIRESLPTIKYAIDKGARVVLASHLGRPKGKVDKKYSLEPVAAKLAELIGAEVALTDEPVGDGARKVVNDLKAGGVALLENLRFSPAEEANEEGFARQLASYADVYVNDAFGTAHRAHASTVGITKFVAAKGMGLLMEREVKFLGQLLGDVERPFIAIIGGAKVSDKIAVLENLLGRVNQLLIGGAMANTFLLALGKSVEKSLAEHDLLKTAQDILAKAKAAKKEIVLPIDAVVAEKFEANAPSRTVSVDAVGPNEMILDIGPKSIEQVVSVLARCKTLVWNGPFGAFEMEPFDTGTVEVAEAAAELTKAGKLVTVAGGGDTVAALNAAGAADRFTYVSTAGGAFLEWLEGKALPGVEVLRLK